MLHYLYDSLDQAACGLIELDGNQQVTYLNAAAQSFLKVNGADILHKPFSELCKRCSCLQELQEILNDFAKEKILEQTKTVIIQAEGSVRLSCFIKKMGGDVAVNTPHDVILLQNITQPVHVIEAMSAEVRIPLTELKAATQGILEDKKIVGEYRFYIEQMSQCTEKIQAITKQFNEFMSYSQMLGQEKLAEVIHVEREVYSIIQDTLEKESLSPLVHLLVDIKPDCMPESVHEHPGFLRYFLTPLLINALRFTHEGYIIISLSAKKQTNAQVICDMSVYDTGCGISPNKLDGLCDMFLTHSTRRGNYKNAGLKLSILKESLAIAGGHMDIQTQLNEGTKVSLSFPCDILPSAMSHWEKMSMFEKNNLLKHDPRILLISDDQALSIVLGRQLPAQKYDALSTEQAQQRLFEKQHKQPRYDIIILDGLSLKDISRQWIKLLFNHELYKNTLLVVFGNHLTFADLHDGTYHEDLILLANMDAKVPFELIKFGQILRERWKKVHAKVMGIATSQKELIPVLIIDDSDFYAISFSKRLEALGCRVDAVYSGEEGIALLNQRKNYYQIIFLDVSLPGAVNGLDVANFIQKNIKLPSQKYPILVGCTAYSTEDELKRCLESGMDYAFSKPMELNTLKSVLGILDEDINDGHHTQ